MYGYDIDLDKLTSANSSISSISMFSIIALIIALAAAIVIYFVFMDKANENKYEGAVKKIYDFLHFTTFVIEPLIKIAYIFSTIYITIIAFGTLQYSVYTFFKIFFFGNILLRMLYEAAMISYRLFINVKEINKKMK